MELARDGQNVALILAEGVLSKGVAGTEVREVDENAAVLDAVPQNVEDTAGIDFVGDPLRELALSHVLVAAVVADELLPGLDCVLPMNR